MSFQAQDQKHQRTILHLWTTATPEETQLLPLEATLSRRIRQRSLRVCLHAWRVRFLFLVKLKRVYHTQLLGRWVARAWSWTVLRLELLGNSIAATDNKLVHRLFMLALQIVCCVFVPGGPI